MMITKSAVKSAGKIALINVVLPYGLGFGQAYIKSKDKTVLGLSYSEWFPIGLIVGGAGAMLMSHKGHDISKSILVSGAALLGERTESMVMNKINRMIVFKKIRRGKPASGSSGQLYDVVGDFVPSPTGFYT